MLLTAIVNPADAHGVLGILRLHGKDAAVLAQEKVVGRLILIKAHGVRAMFLHLGHMVIVLGGGITLRGKQVRSAEQHPAR